MKKRTLDMTSGPITKTLLTFVFPMIITNMLQHLYSAADSAVVGRFVGKGALAAIGATNSATSLILNLLIGLALGSNIVNANLLGAKNQVGLRKSMHCALVLALVGGLCLGAVGIGVSEWVLKLINCPENILKDAALYMRIIFCGTPATMVYNFGSGILRTHGDSKRPMYIMGVSGLVNVGLNLVFVLVFKMTVDGVALATILSKYLSAIWVLCILFDPKDVYKLRLRELKFRKQESWNIIKVGVPCGINSMVFHISNTTVQSAVNAFGDTVVAGGVAANNITGLLYQVLVAFYSGCISFSGQCFGAKKYRRIDRVMLLSSGICVAFVSVASAVITVIPGTFLSIFNTDPDVITVGTVKLIIIAWSYVLYGISESVMGCLRGMRETGLPSVINIFCVCLIRIFWIWFICPIRPDSLILLYMCYPVSYVFSTSSLVAYYVVRRRALDKKLQIARPAQAN